MERFEYIKIPFRWVTKEILTHYKLYSLVEPGGYIYSEVRKGMYSLKQAARIDFSNRVKLLVPTNIYLSENLLVYGNIRPDPQCLQFVSKILVSGNILCPIGRPNHASRPQ